MVERATLVARREHYRGLLTATDAERAQGLEASWDAAFACVGHIVRQRVIEHHAEHVAAAGQAEAEAAAMASEPIRRASSGFSRLSQSGDSSRFAAP